jgi:hypothetical protein
LTNKRKLTKEQIIETFDSQTKAEGLLVLDTMADIARMAAIMGGMSLRAFLETQHANPDLVDMIVERAALLPPLDEPPKAKPPTKAELRKAGKAGKLRVVIETPDLETMEAVKRHGATMGIELVDLP